MARTAKCQTDTMRNGARIAPERERFEWLVALPVLGAILLVWATFVAYTLEQRGAAVARVKTQLDATVSTLADFNELANVAGSAIAAKASQGRSDAIWRALLQYPTASIWVERTEWYPRGRCPPAIPSITCRCRILAVISRSMRRSHVRTY
jgi:hypothetical protein